MFALLCLAFTAPAQTGETASPEQAPKTAPQVQRVLPSYEGQNVVSVELAGQPELDMRELEPVLVQRAGEPFSQEKVDATVAALKRTGRFQEVELELRPDASGIRVLMVLQPATYFGLYDFPGALERFPFSRLVQVSEYPPRGAYTPVDVENARLKLETFFQRSGYFQAQVRPEVRVDRVNGLANVTYHTELKRRAKFGEVHITGTTLQETERLQKALRSWKARFHAAAIRPGKTFSQQRLQKATLYLENVLMKQEHLAGRVKLIGADYNPSTNRADIHFNVQPGPLVQVRIQGAHVWSWTKRKLLPVYQQVGLNPELIQEGRRNLVSHFQSKGYFDARVTVQTQHEPSRETIMYQVTKGPRHKVSDVGIAGNQSLPDKELMSHVAVQKGRLWFISRGKFSDKLLRSSVENLKRVYQAEGFSDVKVVPRVNNQSGNLDVTFQVIEGTRDMVEALRLEGNTVPPTQLAPKGLQVTAGQPYSQKRVDNDRNQIIASYLNKGYLNASFRQFVRPIGGDKHRLEVVYEITEGPQVQIAKVVTLGARDTRHTLIERSSEIRPGQPLRQGDLLTTESQLYTLGIFDWAEVDPRRQITTQSKEDAVVKVHEGKKNSLTYGFGFEVINRGGSVPSGTVALPGIPPVGVSSEFRTSQKTFWGPRGSIEYTRKNFRGKAETITLAGLAARLDQRASFTWANPHFRSTDWSSNLTVTGEHNSTNPIFSSRLAEVGAQLQRALNEDKSTNLFLRYSLRQTGLTRLLLPDLISPEDRHVRLSTFSASYVRDTRDNTLDAHKGIYETFELGINPKVIGSNVNFARLLLQTAYYQQIPFGIVWANSVRLGLAQSFAGSHIPVSEKFFSGGGSTLRGFPLNGAGPQRSVTACGDPADPSTCSLIRVPTGGNQLFILNSEFRIPVPIKKGLGIAAFYDGGNVFDRIGFHDFGSNYTNTVGLGLRYATPVGPVRVDLGHNLNALPGIKATQLFITLGQSF